MEGKYSEWTWKWHNWHHQCYRIGLNMHITTFFRQRASPWANYISVHQICKKNLRYGSLHLLFFQMMIGTIYSIGNLVHLGPMLSLIERSKLETPYFLSFSEIDKSTGIFLASVTWMSIVRPFFLFISSNDNTPHHTRRIEIHQCIYYYFYYYKWVSKEFSQLKAHTTSNSFFDWMIPSWVFSRVEKILLNIPF